MSVAVLGPVWTVQLSGVGKALSRVQEASAQGGALLLQSVLKADQLWDRVLAGGEWQETQGAGSEDRSNPPSSLPLCGSGLSNTFHLVLGR